MHWQIYLGGRSASWSAHMSSNSKNQKLSFRSTGRSTGGDLPVDLPIWALTVWNCHSDPLTNLGGRSASWSAHISSNSKNRKLSFRSTGRSTGIDLPILNTLDISCFSSQMVLSFIRKTKWTCWGFQSITKTNGLFHSSTALLTAGRLLSPRRAERMRKGFLFKWWKLFTSHLPSKPIVSTRSSVS